MSSSNELRDSLASTDSPWKLGRRLIQSPEVSEVGEIYVTDEPSVADEARMDDEANGTNKMYELDTHDFMNRLVIEVPHLIDDPLTDVPEANFEKGLPPDGIKIKPEYLVVDEADARRLERLLASYEAGRSRNASRRRKKVPNK